MKIDEVLYRAARMTVQSAMQENRVDELSDALRAQPDNRELQLALAQAANINDRIDSMIGRQFENWASHPTLRHYMQCWAISVEGKPDKEIPVEMTDEVQAELVKKVMETPDEFAAEMGGLMPQVRAVFVEHGVRPGRTGVSNGMWQYETPVSDMDYEILNLALRTKFGKAIDSGLLLIRRVFSGWRFNAFPRVEDAVNYVRANTPPAE